MRVEADNTPWQNRINYLNRLRRTRKEAECPGRGHAATQRRRRRRLKLAGGSHTRQQVLNLLVVQQGQCALCQLCLSAGYHRDHIVSVVNGGNNSIANIQLLCPKCNLKSRISDRQVSNIMEPFTVVHGKAFTPAFTLRSRVHAVHPRVHENTNGHPIQAL